MVYLMCGILANSFSRLVPKIKVLSGCKLKLISKPESDFVTNAWILTLYNF